jgi:hypothetical protein
MIQSFDTKRSFYQREETVTYNGTRGSLWVRWIDHAFAGRSFVAGRTPTRLQVIESLYHAGVEGVDY